MAIMIVGFILGITIIVGVILCLNQLMQTGLYDQIVQGMNLFVDLFGTNMTVIFLAMFALAGATLCVRFAMSFLGENPGGSANK